ncbi:MAG: hypothetical protein SP1CHLAM54_07990 [Chlamydiia bacterium]|nr:hypothetical protein [Chlamydiia bacterium]MCH9615705.1 hypothetical protein [Chlamydiia bacterium]MCH9628892.1 hypothetical protein [Chlamydiia bacterium]
MRALLLVFTCSLFAHLPTPEANYLNRENLQSLVTPQCAAIPEGGFVYYFNPKILSYLEKPFDLQKIKSLRHMLSPYLTIPLTKQGFVRASSRKTEDQIDTTNYSAVWVRDAAWVYFGLKIGSQKEAKTLLLNLLRFYSSKPQVERFLAVIHNPSIADPTLNPNAKMSVPLIRFSSKTLSHHQVEGKDQVWNHLQFDSHALFLLALIDAIETKLLLPSELSIENYTILSLFPAFFNETKYYVREDAGPWEEELQHNSSTIGLIAASLKAYQKHLLTNKAVVQGIENAIRGPQSKKIRTALSQRTLDQLYKKGVKNVEFNLSLGGEAPDVNNTGYDRRADAALLFLAEPRNTLFDSQPKRIQEVLNIVLSLKGPYGIYRYRLDAYQAMNYWITHHIPSVIHGPKTRALEIMTRFNKGYMPSLQPYDAQWFFDSIIATLYYKLSLQTPSKIARYYLRQGDYHLKRSLGQLTSDDANAVDGESVPKLALPESIGTVFDINYFFRPMPSPICPLAWSTACMRIALHHAELAHKKLN